MSAGILRALSTGGRGMMVSGIPWLNGESREMHVSALGSNILCTRHNNALSSLDAAAADVVSYLRADQVDLERMEEGHSFTLVSGALWERWMLKLLLGGMASGSLGRDGRTIDEWAPDVNEDGLIEVLFYGADFPTETGMAIREEQPPPEATPDEVGVTGLSSSSQGGLIGVALAVGVLEIALSVVPLSGILRRRVGLVRVLRTEPPVEKMVAFAWATSNTDVVDLTRHEGTPPSPQAT